MYLKVSDIFKSFENKHVLKGISFQVNGGETLAIIGESGCGKSTLIKIIAGLLEQDSGDVQINDKGNEYKPSVGYAFQLNALFDSYTVWQNIVFKEYMEGIRSTRSMIRKVYEVMDAVNLSYDVARLYPKDLSGGMQKRVAIARAIVNNPDILFLDEPTSGLDPYTSSKIIETINAIRMPNGNKPIKFAIVHDMSVMKEIADKVLFIKNGIVGWFGDVKDIDKASQENENLHNFVRHL